MERSKSLALLLSVVLAASSLLLIQSSSAQSSTNPAPEFTLKIVDNSYDVAPATITSTDPYTGNTTTTTILGYRVENKTIEATITNNGAAYYNFAYKGHYETQWNYYPSDPQSQNAYNQYDSYNVPCQASNDTTTVIALIFLPKITQGEMDIKIQGLYGGYRAVPYGHAIALPGGPTYDFYFEGTAGEWSNAQTVSYDEVASSPAPTAPEFPSMAILPLLAAISLMAAVFLRKNSKK
ncbi:MAG: hypothetical protein ACQCN6_01435 [Candidatus Bathyarchaeia archaeon]